MKDKQEYKNGRQLHIEDYLQENKMEFEGNVEVPSANGDGEFWQIF